MLIRNLTNVTNMQRKEGRKFSTLLVAKIFNPFLPLLFTIKKYAFWCGAWGGVVVKSLRY